MLQYVGQQHRERQGWGNEEDVAEERVGLHAGVCSPLCFSGVSHFSQLISDRMCSLFHAEQMTNTITHCRNLGEGNHRQLDCAMRQIRPSFQH